MMNKFVESVTEDQNKGLTYNLGATNVSSLNACVDLFGIIGTRNAQFSREFELAFQENADVATRILLWSRDIRGGAGERQTFRNLLTYLEQKHPDVLVKLLPKVPEVGRWDDLLIFTNPAIQTEAFELIREALQARNGLCAKWMPREATGRAQRKRGIKAREAATKLRLFLGLTPKSYRQLLATYTKVVETPMCANKWNQINYDHVPSLAAARYQKAFNKHDPEGYSQYREGLKTGERTIKAGAVYPYDVVKSVEQGDQDVAMAQWKALPNYMGDKRIIPMVDVSGSMYCWNYYGQRSKGVKSNTTPLDVAVSLGLYCADKLEGDYHGMFLSFSGHPELQKLKGNLVQKINQIKRAHWEMNTNIEVAMDKILDVAVQNNVPQNEMPEILLILSDMEFDNCVQGERTIYKVTTQKYESAGYHMPKVVFWNLNSREGNYPVTYRQNGTALVSGFSPAIMKSILASDLEDFTPENVMLQTVMVERYNWQNAA
jgi:hypothetical protein